MTAQSSKTGSRGWVNRRSQETASSFCFIESLSTCFLLAQWEFLSSLPLLIAAWKEVMHIMINFHKQLLGLLTALKSSVREQIKLRSWSDSFLSSVDSEVSGHWTFSCGRFIPNSEIWQFQQCSQTPWLGMSEKSRIPTRELVCLIWIFKLYQIGSGSPSAVGEFPSVLCKE